MITAELFRCTAASMGVEKHQWVWKTGGIGNGERRKRAEGLALFLSYTYTWDTYVHILKVSFEFDTPTVM